MDFPLCYFVSFVVNFLVFCARISLIRFYLNHFAAYMERVQSKIGGQIRGGGVEFARQAAGGGIG